MSKGTTKALSYGHAMHLGKRQSKKAKAYRKRNREKGYIFRNQVDYEAPTQVEWINER